MASAVVIVPGFGGSELWSPSLFGWFGSLVKYWIDLPWLAAGGWRLLRLNDQLQPDVPGQGVLTAGHAVMSHYGTICGRFRRLGYEVFTPVQEWRGPLSFDGDRLLDLVKELAQRFDRIHLVGHCRGGLVIRAALNKISAAGLRDLIGNIVMVGTPQYGTWEGVGLLAGWAIVVILFETVGMLLPIPAWSRLFLGTVHQCMLTWAGGYEMLPAPNAPGLSAHEITAAYSPVTYTSRQIPIKTQWLTLAQQTWSSLPLPASTWRITSVVGYGGETKQHWPAPNDVTWPGEWTRDRNGDITVPVEWAKLPGHPTVMIPAAHSALVWDPRCLDEISRAVVEGPSGDRVLGGEFVAPGILG